MPFLCPDSLKLLFSTGIAAARDWMATYKPERLASPAVINDRKPHNFVWYRATFLCLTRPARSIIAFGSRPASNNPILKTHDDGQTFLVIPRRATVGIGVADAHIGLLSL
jgi:hypothetical protein